MKTDFVTGGCGFVGRNLVNRLLASTDRNILIVDDLSTGIHPSDWLNLEYTKHTDAIWTYGSDQRVTFIQSEIRSFLQSFPDPAVSLQRHNIPAYRLSDVYHLAAIVGGREGIEGDPVRVALDLAIDAEFFFWVSRYKPLRVLYPSSSAAYPVALQTASSHSALKETDIRFDTITQPDMTYGWSKLTGEYLARLTAQHYNISIACVRPFSGYGPGQSLDYPIPALINRFIKREDPIEVWGTGEQKRDFIYIDDVLDGFELALDHIADGSAVNLGSGEPVSFLEIIALLSDISGYQPAIKKRLDKPVGVHARYSDMLYVQDTLRWMPKIGLKDGLEMIFQEMNIHLV